MKQPYWVCLLFGLVLPCACGQAANLIQNPDFDNGLTAWNYVSFGAFLIDNADGSPSAPAAQLSTIPFSIGSNLQLTQCVLLAGSPPPWEFGMRVRVVSAAGSSCQIYVYADIGNDSSCSLPQTGTWVGVPASTGGVEPGMQGTFTEYAGTTNDPMPGGIPSHAAALIVSVNCANTGDSMTLNVDHAYLGTSGTTPVRLQSFDVM